MGREADATNQLHFNVPTGATMEWSVNDVAEATLSATLFNLTNNTLDNPGGACNIWDSSGIVTAGFVRILNQGELRLREGSGGGTNEILLRAPATLAADYTLTFPADDGTACQRLTTDGAGVLTWATVGAGTAPVFGRAVRTAGDLTTSCTSLVDITCATTTFTTGAFPVHYALAVAGYHCTNANTVRLNADIDGTALHGSTGLGFITAVATSPEDLSFSGQTAALTAASHTIKARWSVGTGTATLRASTTLSLMWSAFEIR